MGYPIHVDNVDDVALKTIFFYDRIPCPKHNWTTGEVEDHEAVEKHKPDYSRLTTEEKVQLLTLIRKVNKEKPVKVMGF